MNNINYYKKYLKYKQKYLKYKLIGGGIETVNENNKKKMIPIKHFNVSHLDSVQEFLNNYDMSTINMNVKDLNFIQENDIVIGIIGYESVNIKTFTLTERSHIQQLLNEFIDKNNYTIEEFSEKELMKGFFINTEENGPEIAMFIKEKFPDKDAAYDFIKNFTNPNDFNKNIIYYAVRYGIIELLLFILEHVGEDNFRKLMDTRDIEGRTPFMISTHASNNQEETFSLIKRFTSHETLHAYDYGSYKNDIKYNNKKLNALGWYNIRDQRNTNILLELQAIFDDKEFL